MNRKLAAITGALIGACPPARTKPSNDSDNFHGERGKQRLVQSEMLEEAKGGR